AHRTAQDVTHPFSSRIFEMGAAVLQPGKLARFGPIRLLDGFLGIGVSRERGRVGLLRPFAQRLYQNVEQTTDLYRIVGFAVSFARIEARAIMQRIEKTDCHENAENDE